MANSIELSEWVLSNSTRHDASLLGAFVYAMKQQKMYAAPPDDFAVAFEEFRNEVAA